MTLTIKPGTPVATFKLPIPLTGMQQIGELLQAVYGTGEVMLRPAGDQITAVAPYDGFGPLKTDALAAPSAQPDDMQLEYFELLEDGLKLGVHDPGYALAVVAEMLWQHLESFEAVNYVQLDPTHPGEPRPYVLVLQRTDGKTPYELRAAAEARVAELEEELAELRGAKP